MLLACGGSEEENIGSQTADVVTDTRVLKEANAAAAEVIRAGGDCDAVKAALPETNRKLDEAEQNVRTETGRVSLAAIRKQVNNAASICP
jgi:hypothetical protein